MSAAVAELLKKMRDAEVMELMMQARRVLTLMAMSMDPDMSPSTATGPSMFTL